MKKELMKQVTLATTLLTSLSLAPLSSLAEESTPSSSSTGEPTIISSSSETRTTTSSDAETSTQSSSSKVEESSTPTTASSSSEETATTSLDTEASTQTSGSEVEENSNLNPNQESAVATPENTKKPLAVPASKKINYVSKYPLPKEVTASRALADEAVNIYAQFYYRYEAITQAITEARYGLHSNTSGLSLEVLQSNKPRLADNTTTFAGFYYLGIDLPDSYKGSTASYQNFIAAVKQVMAANEESLKAFNENPDNIIAPLFYITPPYYVEANETYLAGQNKSIPDTPINWDKLRTQKTQTFSGGPRFQYVDFIQHYGYTFNGYGGESSGPIMSGDKESGVFYNEKATLDAKGQLVVPTIYKNFGLVDKSGYVSKGFGGVGQNSKGIYAKIYISLTPAPQVATPKKLQDVYRLYHPGLQVHLYSSDTNERTVLLSRGWQNHGLAWKSEATDGKPVYRLYNPDIKYHFYTTDANEYKVLGQRGWKQEGVAYRSSGKIPIYRLYHAGIKKHLFTRDKNEYKVLATRGWKQEGLAWYAAQ